MNVEKYKTEFLKHLSKSAVAIKRAKLTEIIDNCSDMLNDLEELISEKELAFLDEKINSKVIPQPKILIKDHKKPDYDGNFPTRLVVPATNFTAGFPKLGYMGSKKHFRGAQHQLRHANDCPSLKLKRESRSLRSQTKQLRDCFSRRGGNVPINQV
jgi:hypothetical protein